MSYSGRNSHTVVGRSSSTKQLIAEMSWDDDTGEVKGVFIHPDFSSSGLEEELWKRAEQYSKDAGVISPVNKKDPQ